MKHEPSDWQIDVASRQALHISGLLLRAELQAQQWQVHPHPSTLPPHGPPMPPQAQAAPERWIRDLVLAGGQLLVEAIGRHTLMN